MKHNSFSIEVKDQYLITRFHGYDHDSFHELYVEIKKLVDNSALGSGLTSIVDLSHFVDNQILISNQDIGYIHLITKLALDSDVKKIILIPETISCLHEIVNKITDILSGSPLAYAPNVESALKRSEESS